MGGDDREMPGRRAGRATALGAAALLALVSPARGADCAIDPAQAIVVPPSPGDARDAVKHAYKLADGSIVFLGSLEVDVDGAPKAYGPDNSGLDDLRNAGSPGKWFGIATDAPRCGPTGNPLVQSTDDPAPGFYVSTTAMTNPAIRDCRKQRNFVDATTIPYVALSPALATIDRSTEASGRGKLVAVARVKGGDPALALQADTAPRYGIGEGSMALVRKLGLNPDPRRGGTASRDFVYVILGARMGFPASAAAVDSAAGAAFQDWGGNERLAACRQALLAAPR
jgi:hypothetical protein